MNSLSFPIDIPWKKVMVSPDMMDRAICDHKSPYRWRSSVAVFSYQPPDEQQTFEGMLVSYLRVACTITGFQEDSNEIGIKDGRVSAHWWDTSVINDYLNTVSKYYACYGAILEVAVAPSGSKKSIPLSQYPYFADFDPKKRELFELVTETGEVMSRTQEGINVRKGLTTSESHENVDTTSIGVQTGVNVGFASAGGQLQHSWGSTDKSSEQKENVNTTDKSKEARENLSHTTQLTQMYHQLDSYHLGTNRAVFFMLPRPHITDPTKIPSGKSDPTQTLEPEVTFVNGPRALEGIQEFFLVVLRPKSIKDICINAYLETAHTIDVPSSTTESLDPVDPGNMHFQLSTDRPPNLSSPKTKEASKNFPAPENTIIDTDNNNGYKILSLRENGKVVTSVHSPNKFSVTVDPNKKTLTVYGLVHSSTQDETFNPTTHSPQDKVKAGGDTGPEPGTKKVPAKGSLDARISIYLLKHNSVYNEATQNLWLTGRSLCNCGGVDSKGRHKAEVPSVTWEGQLDKGKKAIKSSKKNEKVGMSIQEANQMGVEIGQRMLESVNHVDRYEAGTVSFAETQFVARRMAAFINAEDHPDNKKAYDIDGLDEAIRNKIEIDMPNVTRWRLLVMSPAEQRDRFGLNQDEIHKLRRALLGLEGPAPVQSRRWDPPDERRVQKLIPDVMGIELNTAYFILSDDQFFIGKVTYQDSELPRNTVLNQTPSAKTAKLSRSEVDLVVASGLSVLIPDLIGEMLSEALVELRRSGLESEPHVVFERHKEKPRNTVLSITPRMRTYVTPNSDVELIVSAGIK